MKKQYTFTDNELRVIKEALIEYWQTGLKHLNPQSPYAIEHKRLAFELKEQFKRG